MNEAHEVQRLADYLWEHHNAEAQAGDLNNDSTATTAIRLLDRLRDAEEVAEAVKWCQDELADVEFYDAQDDLPSSVRVSVLGDDGVWDEFRDHTFIAAQAGIRAARAALRARVEGKRAPEGDAEKGE